MCGLIYARSKNADRSVNREVLKQLARQRHRGTEGFGLYDVEFEHIVKETAEKKMKRYLEKHPSSEMIFHHRWPTSTDNTKLGAHPYSTRKFFEGVEYILIHNGVIRNAWKLATDHEERGITYWSVHEDGRFNDSESLLWDFALYMEGVQDGMRAEGGAAFICYEKHPDDPSKNKLHYFRNGSYPLIKRENKRFFFLTSEATKDAGGISVEADKLFSYNYSDGKTAVSPLIVKTFSYEHPTPYVPAPYKDRSEFESDIEHIINNVEDEEERELEAMGAYLEDESETPQETELSQQKRLFTDTEQLAADFKSKTMEALHKADGYYYLAVEMLREEIMNLDEEDYSIENWYAKEVIRGAIAILIADPFWNLTDSETRHPQWAAEDWKDELETNNKTFTLPSDKEIAVAVTPKVREETTNQFHSSGSPSVVHDDMGVVGREFSRDSTSLLQQVLRQQSERVEKRLETIRGFNNSQIWHSAIETPSLVRSIPHTEPDEPTQTVLNFERGLPMKV